MSQNQQHNAIAITPVKLSIYKFHTVCVKVDSNLHDINIVIYFQNKYVDAQKNGGPR